MEERFKFRRVNEITGTFVLIVVILVVAALFMAGRAQRWFAPSHDITVLLPEAGAFGLAAGADVNVMGVRAGWIKRIEVENTRLLARATIDAKFRPLVRTDSVVELQRAFAIAGDTFLDIQRGEGPLLPETEVLVARPPPDFMAEFEELMAAVRNEVMPLAEQVQDTLEQWGALGADLRGSQQHLAAILESVAGMTAEMAEGRGTAGRLIMDENLADELEKIVQQAGVAMEELRRVLDNLERGTARLPELGDVLTAEAMDLPMLTMQAKQTLREIEIFFEGLQRHWLVRGYMEPGVPRPRIPPGQVEGGR
jgi:phospholipid/cholesterol/gamma-HCH transport system substrate-binding protein